MHTNMHGLCATRAIQRLHNPQGTSPAPTRDLCPTANSTQAAHTGCFHFRDALVCKSLGGNAQHHARGLTAAQELLQTQNKIMTPPTAVALASDSSPHSQAVAEAVHAADRHSQSFYQSTVHPA
jgi:hypothetical protein